MLALISVSPVLKSRTVPLTVCRTWENTKVGSTRRRENHRNRCSCLVLIVSICKDRKEFVNKFLYFYLSRSAPTPSTPLPSLLLIPVNLFPIEKIAPPMDRYRPKVIAVPICLDIFCCIFHPERIRHLLPIDDKLAVVKPKPE